jgi:hypothetical protein
MTTGAAQLVRDNNQMLQLTYASLGILFQSFEHDE